MSQWRQRVDRLLCECGLALPLSEDDLEQFAADLGLTTHVIPVASDVKDSFRHGRHVGVKMGKPHADRLWDLAHEIAHAILHKGDQTALEWQSVAQQESEANDLAGYLLIGDEWLAEEPWEIADMFGLPRQRVYWWVSRRLRRVRSVLRSVGG